MDKQLGVLIGGFIAILIGINLLTPLADNIYLNTNTRDITNETIAIATEAGQTAQDDLTTLSYFGNSTEDLTSMIDTGVNWTTAGVITTNASVSDGNYNISYNYEPDEYVSNATSRTLLSILVLFFVLAIIAAAIAMLRKAGIFDMFK